MDTPDKSTRFTLTVTAVFIVVLMLAAWLLQKKAAPRASVPVPPPAPVAVVVPESEAERAAAAGPEMPRDQDHKPLADYEIITGAVLVEDPVNDGDTFLLRTPEGDQRFCLYWADTVETDGGQPEGTRRLAEHFGFSSEEPLRALGVEARDFSVNLLRTFPFRIVTKWERDEQENAFLAYIYLKQPEEQYMNLSEYVVRFGLAMPRRTEGVLPDGATAEQFEEDLHNAEAEAREHSRGGWKARPQ